MADRTTTTRRGLLAGAAVALAGARPGQGQATDPDYTPIFENPDPISSPPDGGTVDLPIIAQPEPPPPAPGATSAGAFASNAATATTGEVTIHFEVESIPPSLTPTHGQVKAAFNPVTGRLEAVISLRKVGRGGSVVRAYIRNKGGRRWARDKRVQVQ